ncbi:hypothetical protein PG993_000455 [Apiospora rasikravindrae]|uniref:Uncharacterized protein n=1 Tax=Apiospora rasikravindrae TaxID=990691 RepID=A0ABR1U8L3_9PEZI
MIVVVESAAVIRRHLTRRRRIWDADGEPVDLGPLGVQDAQRVLEGLLSGEAGPVHNHERVGGCPRFLLLPLAHRSTVADGQRVDQRLWEIHTHLGLVAS